MSQFNAKANVTEDSSIVVLPGVDATPYIKSGNLFFLDSKKEAIYYVASEPTYSAPDTTVPLTANFAEPTDVDADATFSTSFSPIFGFPYPTQNDNNTAEITARAINKIDTAIASNLIADYGDLSTPDLLTIDYGDLS